MILILPWSLSPSHLASPSLTIRRILSEFLLCCRLFLLLLLLLLSTGFVWFLIRGRSTPDQHGIRKIHLISHDTQDTLIWHYEKNGLFSVKTCYHLIMDNKMALEGKGETSDPSNRHKFWKKVWGIKTIPRTLSFLWQCCNGVLPCKSNLFRRKHAHDPFCEECGGVETELHVLFSCRMAKKVWRMQPHLLGFGKTASDFHEWMGSVLRSHDEEMIEDWARVTHGIWLARNLRVFQGLVQEPEEIIDVQIRAQMEFRSSRMMSRKGPAGPSHSVGKWSKPPMGFIKVNCDASASEGGCGIGFIGRDESGRVLFYGSRSIQEGSSPEVAEAEAILWAVEFAKTAAFTNVIFESDCLGVIHALHKKNADRSILGVLIDNILLKAWHVGTYCWRYSRRECNRAAHFLAKIRPTSSFTSCQFPSFLIELDNIVFADIG